MQGVVMRATMVLVLRYNLLGIIIYDVKYANSVLIKFRCAYL